MRAALAILCTCVLFVLGVLVSPAEAGGYRYYGDGYYSRHRGNVWYSSKCCYKKIVRHVREVRYVRIAPRPRYGYYGPYRPWREGYYGPRRPWRPAYYGRPASYTDVYVGPARRYEGYPPGYVSSGYDAYNAADVAVAPVCVRRRVPVLDGRGGWVWGFKKVCN